LPVVGRFWKEERIGQEMLALIDSMR